MWILVRMHITASHLKLRNSRQWHSKKACEKSQENWTKNGILIILKDTSSGCNQSEIEIVAWRWPALEQQRTHASRQFIRAVCYKVSRNSLPFNRNNMNGHICFFSKATTFEQKVNHRKCKHQSMENDGYEDATLFSVHSNTNKIRRNCFISFLT